MFVLKLVLLVVFGTATVAAVNAPYCRCNDQPLTSTLLTTTPVTSPSSPPTPLPSPSSPPTPLPSPLPGPCPDNIVCENAGRCVIVNGEFDSCSCFRGSFGDRCEFIECSAERGRNCLNGGTCTVVDRSEICICPPRIEGFFCDINTTLCDNVNCNRGECVVEERATVARCECKPGATGEFCENDLCLSVNCGNSIECEVRSQYIQDNRDPVRCDCSLPGAQFCQGDTCLNQPSSFCQNRGTCVGDSVGNRGCLCAEGFSGTMCEVGPCPNDVLCENGGVCVIVNGEFNRCRCSEGYYGDRCELAGCKDGGQGDCQNEATCQFLGGREVCFCSEGFKGVFCELGPCFGVTCLNGGTCEEGFSSFFNCNCPLGFSGRFCEETFCTNRCLNGQCILHLVETDRPFNNEVDGDTECVCSAGDTNPLCELCIDVECFNGGTCITDNGIAECVCPDGISGPSCLDDPCNSCPSGSTCIREGGDTVRCQCRDGFSGQFCEDDPCRFSSCGNGTCVVDESGAPVCDCLEGYFGQFCHIYADCPEVLADICLNGGTCLINEIFGFERCLCQAGYAGLFCEHEPCINYPCPNGVPCEIVDDQPKCVCPEGLGGDFCDLVVCHNGGQGDCQNGATCDLVDGEEVCICPPGIRGQFCELIACQNGLQGDCLNGATCDFLEGAGEVCICPRGYWGQFCELNTCSGVNCMNGASCTQFTDNFSCECRGLFEGIFCELERPHECDDPTACLDGRCLRFGGEALCSCLEGDTDPFCINCVDHDCHNGGTCITPETAVSTATCLCPEGFSGQFCDNSICSNLLDPCGRRGTCIVEGDDTFSCVCAEGVLGEFCEDDPCNTHVECVDGTCAVGADGAAFCDCNEGAIGERCENPCCCPELEIDCGSGTCVRSPDGQSAVCVCPEGFVESPGGRCELEECPDDTYAGVCQNGGTCFSRVSVNGGPGGFRRCDCPEGYVGSFCNHAPCEYTPCLNDSSCIVEGEHAVCVCRDGFEGRFCEQVVSR